MIKTIETFASNLNVPNILFVFFVFDKVSLLDFKLLEITRKTKIVMFERDLNEILTMRF